MDRTAPGGFQSSPPRGPTSNDVRNTWRSGLVDCMATISKDKAKDVHKKALQKAREEAKAALLTTDGITKSASSMAERPPFYNKVHKNESLLLDETQRFHDEGSTMSTTWNAMGPFNHSFASSDCVISNRSLSSSMNTRTSGWNPCGEHAAWANPPKPFGPLQRKLDKRLKERIDEATREMHFDALVRTNGTFKRQVWAEMMRDNVIGTDDNNSGLKERKHGVEGFRHLLARCHGSIVRGWRTALDVYRRGRVSFTEFCQAARSLGYEGPLRRLWSDLAGDGAFITLAALDPDADKRLGNFRNQLWQRCRGVHEGWKLIDNQQKCRIQVREFKQRCADLGIVWLALQKEIDGKPAPDRREAEKEAADVFDYLDFFENKFVTWLEFRLVADWKCYADHKELDAFGAFTKQHGFDTLSQVLDKLGGPHLKAERFIAGLCRLGYQGDGRRLFSCLDTDGNGHLSGSEVVSIFTKKVAKNVKPIVMFNPVPAITGLLTRKLGVTMTRAQVQELARPIQKSYFIYDAALKELQRTENDDLEALFALEDYLADLSDNEFLQPEPKLDFIIKHAAEAQSALKRKIVPPGTEWPTGTGTWTTVDWLDYVFDPGIKGRERIEAKAHVKYKPVYGRDMYRRVRDISRLAFQFKTCDRMFKALEKAREVFDVIEVENRMRVPTSLGWRDVTMLIRERLSGGKFHICEIQFQLCNYADARKKAHKEYKKLREALPNFLPDKTQSETDMVVTEILEGLQATIRSFTLDTGNVACNLDRAKTWTLPWQENPLVACNRDWFPAKRPHMPISDKNSGWIDEQRSRLGPVVPNLLCGRPWQPSNVPGNYFSVFEADNDCADLPSINTNSQKIYEGRKIGHNARSHTRDLMNESTNTKSSMQSLPQSASQPSLSQGLSQYSDGSQSKLLSKSTSSLGKPQDGRRRKRPVWRHTCMASS